MEIKVMTHTCGEDKIFVSRCLYSKLTSNYNTIMFMRIRDIKILVDDTLPPDWILIPCPLFYKESKDIQMARLLTFIQGYYPADR